MPPPAAPLYREWMQPALDGTLLFARAWEPAAPARGSVLITHGLGEHSGRYWHVVQRLTDAGLRVLTWDLRGHGRSEGPRGDIPRYHVLTDDLREVCRIATSGPGPLFLYGHSLGGQITLNFAAAHRPDAAGLIITSPWLSIVFRPSPLKLALAWIATHVWPSFTQETDLDATRLSRDLDFLKAMPDLDLVHHRLSARMYRALTAGARRALLEAAALPYPVLFVHGDHDPVTSLGATEQLYGAMQTTDKTLLVVPGAFHETHNDLCRESVLAQIVAWITARAPLQPH